MKIKIITPGLGHYRLDHYPIGGCFRRFAGGEIITVRRDYKSEGLDLGDCCGCSHDGDCDGIGRIAFRLTARDCEVLA